MPIRVKSCKIPSTIIIVLPNNCSRKSKRYQPSGAGGTRSAPAMPHHLQNPKWPPGGPKWPTCSGKGSNPRFLGAVVNFP